MSEQTPSANGPSNGDGRNSRGQFAPGNPGGPGNPQAASAAKHRAEFWRRLRAKDIAQALRVIRQVMNDKTAKPADRLTAARELLDRVLGRPVQSDLMERIERLEALLAAREQNANGSN
jgi:hypothetical protein